MVLLNLASKPGFAGVLCSLTKDSPHGAGWRLWSAAANDDVKHSHVCGADRPEEECIDAEPHQRQSSTHLCGLHQRQHPACRCW
jgi:hypothetical protein